MLRQSAVLLALFACLSNATNAQTLTLEQALRLAESNNPLLGAAQAEVGASRAELRESQALLWNNPQLSAEARQRRIGQVNEPDVSRRDSSIGISQTFETGGQARARREAAGAAVNASEAEVEAARRELRADVSLRFFQVLVLQRRAQMEQDGLDLVQRASTMVARRVGVGEDSRLDGNLATVEAERSANQLAQTKEQLLQARYALAAALNLPAEAEPHATGELPESQPPYSRDGLLALSGRHPKVRASEARERAAAGRLRLEQASRAPDITVGLAYGPERGIDTRDRITTLSLSVPLPIFRQNEGAIGRAASDLEKGRLERLTAQRESTAAVLRLWQHQDSLQARVKRLRESVLGKLDENLKLSLKALQAGELSLGQYLLVRRQALDAQRDLLDATAELAQVRVELETAAGWPEQLPPTGLQEDKKP